MNSVDLNISKSFVIKIADLYMPYLFGNGVISQKPWIIIEHSDSFVIKGTFHGNLSRRGGVAEIEISKKDGRIINYIKIGAILWNDIFINELRLNYSVRKK